jgi:hypothetical protein
MEWHLPLGRRVSHFVLQKIFSGFSGGKDSECFGSIEKKNRKYGSTLLAIDSKTH